MKTLDQIAAELQGYDPHAMTADQVGAFLAELVEPVTHTETVGVADTLGRVLAEDVISPVSVPPHDNSAMDGYAFAGAVLSPACETRLRVVGTAYAGAAWRGDCGVGECVKIMTGAVMPARLDTVVPLEFVRDTGSEIVFPAGTVQTGDNRRRLGEDLMAGQPALRQGERIGPAAMGLLASLGISTVAVRRRIRVAYFSTGDEILSLGEPPREGAVYDSNRYTVRGLLTRLGAEMIDMGVVRDDPETLQRAFALAASSADAVITSGGVSVGEADHTKRIMRSLGDVAFWRIAMRPGRPMAVGRMSGHQGRQAVLFGLPGNPVAVMVTFLAFVRPALLHMMGATPSPPVCLKARSVQALRKKPGRTEYQRGRVSTDAHGGLQVALTGNQGSGVLRSMVEANGLIVLHHDQADVAPGDEVDVLMFDGVLS